MGNRATITEEHRTIKNTTTCRLEIEKRGFSPVERYCETTLSVVHHTDIMSVAYDKLYIIR